MCEACCAAAKMLRSGGSSQGAPDRQSDNVPGKDTTNFRKTEQIEEGKSDQDKKYEKRETTQTCLKVNLIEGNIQKKPQCA